MTPTSPPSARIVDIVQLDPMLDTIRASPCLVSLRLVTRALGRNEALMAMLDLAVAKRLVHRPVGDLILLSRPMHGSVTGACTVILVRDHLRNIRRSGAEGGLHVPRPCSCGVASAWRRLVLWRLVNGGPVASEGTGACQSVGKRTRLGLRVQEQRRDALVARLIEREIALWMRSVEELLRSEEGGHVFPVERADRESILANLVPRALSTSVFGAPIQRRRQRYVREFSQAVPSHEHPGSWRPDVVAETVANWVFCVRFAHQG